MKHKNKPWSASQSRSPRGEACVCLCGCVCVLKEEKQRGWEAYIVKNEGLVTADWFSLGWGMFFLWGRDEEKGSRTREPEMKGACNMAS